MEDKVAVVVGLGGIGRAIAHRVHSIGVNVIGVRRSKGAVPGVGRMVSPDALGQALCEADFVILAVPAY